MVLLLFSLVGLQTGCADSAKTEQSDAALQTEEQTEEKDEEPETDEMLQEEENEETGEAEDIETEETDAQEEMSAAQAFDSYEFTLENPQTDDTTTAVVYYTYEKEYQDEDGNTCGSLSFEIPQLTMRSISAQTINQDILTKYHEILLYSDSDAEELEQYSESMGYSVTYIGDEWICLLLEGYVYTGGAHGLPFRNTLIYNLESGECAQTEDLFDVTEETFTTLYTQAFQDLIAESPEEYWDDATDTVSEEANFQDAAYYLTDTGVTFYFEPYVLAAYARGYVEAEIPYEKLPIK
jgi:hypothetical protein